MENRRDCGAQGLLQELLHTGLRFDMCLLPIKLYVAEDKQPLPKEEVREGSYILLLYYLGV